MKEGWEVKRLGEVCEIVNGGTPDTKVPEYWDGDNLWITPKDMGKLDGIYVDDTERKITVSGLKNSSAKMLPINSIILSSRAPIGHLAINNKEIATNQGCKGIIPKDKLLTLYAFYYLKKSVKLLDSLGSGTTFKEISGSTLAQVKIPVPPLPEQQRIVKTLDEAFAAIAKAKENAVKNLQNAREIFQSYLQSVFANTGDGWEEKKLGEVYDVRDGTHDSPKFHKSGFALITSKNLKSDSLNYDNVQYISEDDYKKINQRSKVDKGDILFAMIGTIGNPVVIENKPDFAIKNVALFKIPTEQCSYFLKYYLDSKFIIDKMAREANGTTQKFVGLGYLRNFKIMLPNINEQRTVVKKLNTLSAETKKLETIYNQKLTALEELKKSILEKAFSGEL